jgi:hypothetical protein
MPTHLGIIRSTCMEQVVDSHPVQLALQGA